MQVFDPILKQHHRERAALSPEVANYAYLRDEVAERLMERLEDVHGEAAPGARSTRGDVAARPSRATRAEDLHAVEDREEVDVHCVLRRLVREAQRERGARAGVGCGRSCRAVVPGACKAEGAGFGRTGLDGGFDC